MRAIKLFAALAFAISGAHAQQWEAVISLDGVSSSDATEAMADMYSDPAMEGNKVTLYAAEFGVAGGSHLIVADYDNYAERDPRTAQRLASHGWSRFMLAMQDAEVVGMEMAGVVADHGAPRHTAGYLVAFIARVSEPAAYASALAELNRAEGNPGVLRLVALRTGSRDATHAVLVGGENFAAVHGYLDELFASEAFGDFADDVGDIREIVRVSTYRRLGAWGY